MRNLTIKRTKTFVASLAKMRVYIEDQSSNEMVINNVPCRKLGVIKNGEEKTFEIDDNEAKVFVIADKLSKGFCSEFYNIPAGEEDVFLSGKNRFNPANGNAFRFDGVTDEDVLKNRKKGTRKGIIFLVVCFIIGLIIGLAATSDLFENVEPETYTADGMEITLTNQFSETSMDGFTACYESSDAAILVLKEEFALAEGFGDLTLEQYGQLIIEGSEFDSSIQLQNDNGVTYFEYQFTDYEYNDTYNYFTVIYKTSDAFWMFQFASLEEDYPEYQPLFMEWAESVEFAN